MPAQLSGMGSTLDLQYLVFHNQRQAMLEQRAAEIEHEARVEEGAASAAWLASHGTTRQQWAAGRAPDLEGRCREAVDQPGIPDNFWQMQPCLSSR